MQQVIIEQARRLLGQGLADERVEEATGLSLAAIIGLRAESATCALRTRKPSKARAAANDPPPEAGKI